MYHWFNKHLALGLAEPIIEEDFERLLRVNVKGVYNCIHATVPHMKGKGGVILNMASIAALVGLPERFAYSMTKGAVGGMTISVAKDYLQHNIRCNRKEHLAKSQKATSSHF